MLRSRLCKMKSLYSFLVFSLFCLHFGYGLEDDDIDIGGPDLGPMDPFKLGLIDPVALEAAAQYVLIVPIVVFLFGLLVIATVLVITFLFVGPLLIPNTRKEGRNFVDNGVFQQPIELAQRMLGSSEECINRISCEILRSSKSSSLLHNMTHGILKFLNKTASMNRKLSTDEKDACGKHFCDFWFIKLLERWSQKKHIKNSSYLT